MYSFIFLRQTLEKRLEIGMYANRTKNWLSLLESVTTAYNNSYHSSIGRTPNSVTSENAAEVFDFVEQQNSKKTRQTETKFKIGDIVRIPVDPNKKQVFKKGAKANWSKEYYIINRIDFHSLRPTFIVKSELGDVLTRPFYEEELNFVMSSKELEEERLIALKSS